METIRTHAPVLLLVAALAALAGCGGTGTTTVEGSEALEEGDRVNAVEAALAIDEVSLRGGVAEAGGQGGGEAGRIVPAASQVAGPQVSGPQVSGPQVSGPRFAAGEPIHLSMQVDDATPGREVRVAWIAPGPRQIASEAREIAEGEESLTFEAPDTSRWPGGEYRVEVWYANERVEEIPFVLLGRDPVVVAEGTTAAGQPVPPPVGETAGTAVARSPAQRAQQAAPQPAGPVAPQQRTGQAPAPPDPQRADPQRTGQERAEQERAEQERAGQASPQREEPASPQRAQEAAPQRAEPTEPQRAEPAAPQRRERTPVERDLAPLERPDEDPARDRDVDSDEPPAPSPG